MIWLNLGCGVKIVQAPKPWVNVDNWPGCEPDLLCDILHLPYEDASAELVYAGHVVEHLDYGEELRAFLHEVRRVLTPDGLACFVGPDHDRVTGDPRWRKLEDYDELERRIREGDENYPGAEHKWCATGPKALVAVREVFPDACEVEVNLLPSMWPVFAYVAWQFAIVTGGLDDG
jgi:predicted SAM-dependent methyltransferase